MKMHSRVLFIVLFVLGLVGPGAVEAATETVRVYPIDDSVAQLYDDDYIVDWNEARNYQGEIFREPISDAPGKDAGKMKVRSDDGAGSYRIYRVSNVFDLPEILDGKNISEVKLILTGVSSDPSQDSEIVITSHKRESLSQMSKPDWLIQNYGTEAFSRGWLNSGKEPTSFSFNEVGVEYFKSVSDHLVLGI